MEQPDTFPSSLPVVLTLRRHCDVMTATALNSGDFERHTLECRPSPRSSAASGGDQFLRNEEFSRLNSPRV